MKIIFKKGIIAFITLLAVFNLIYLLFIREENFDFSESANVSTQSTTPATDFSEYEINVPGEAMIYDGKGKLNLTAQLSATGPDGKDLSADVTAEISEGTEDDCKVITYTLETEGGEVTATRDLQLVDYETPYISVPEDNELYIDNTDFDALLDGWITNEQVSADDGFGNDISDKLSYSYDYDPDSNIFTFILTVKNQVGDKAKNSFVINVEPGILPPVVELTNVTVSIDGGTFFEAYDYVKSAYDYVDGDLTEYVQYDGYVDTTVEGTYKLNYYVTNSAGLTSDYATLTVMVN